MLRRRPHQSAPSDRAHSRVSRAGSTSNCLHVTKNGVESKYCTVHEKKRSSRHKRQKVVSYEKSVEVTERARIRMVNRRKSKKYLLAGIIEPEVQRIAKQLANMKSKQKAYVVIDSVTESINPKDIILSGSAEPIDFTDQKSPPLRTMQEIADESKYHFANVISALKFVFPGCTQYKTKVLQSLANDTPQKTHTDMDVSLINKRVSNLEAFHYSVIIALQTDTHLLTGIERDRLNIPVNSKIIFRGDFIHAGGGYAADNARLFISFSSVFYPSSDSVYFIN